MSAPWRILACLILLGTVSCSPGRIEQTEPDESASPGGAGEAPPPDLDQVRDACLSSPQEFATCMRYVREASRGGEDAIRRAAADFERLLSDEPGSWLAPLYSGLLRERTGGAELAREAYRHALRNAEAGNDHLGQARSLYELGRLTPTGDPEAVRRFRRSVELARIAGDDLFSTYPLFRLARLHRGAGRYEDELAALEELLPIRRSEGNSRALRVALFQLAEVTRKLGRFSEASERLHEVLRLSEEAGDTGNLAFARLALGLIALDEGDPEGAHTLFRAATEYAGTIGNEEYELHSRILEAHALRHAGRLEEARRLLEAALPRSKALAEQAHVHNVLYLADVERLSAEPAAAAGRYLEAAALAEQRGLPELRWQAFAGRAAAMRDAGDSAAASIDARRAVDLVEELRDAVSMFGERTRFLHVRADAYEILASSLASTGRLEDAFEVADRAHARTLREAIRARRDDGPAASGTSLAQVRNRVRAGDLLVTYLLGEDESLLLAVDSSGVRSHVLPRRSEIEKAVQRYVSVLRRPLDSLDARLDPEADFRRLGSSGYELFRLLLGPESDRVAAARRLLVVGDRRLHRLPFEALPTAPVAAERSPGFLGARVAVAYLPSASMIPERMRSTGGSVAVLLEPDGYEPLDLPPLQYAVAEAEAVVRAHDGGAARVLEGASAAELDEVLSRDPGVLHVAAHAVLDPGVGPRILLDVRDGGPVWLSAADVAEWPSAPRLVVLSACETGEGELVGGEGVLGLVRAFTLAGSEQIVASLWPLGDAAAVERMRAFHAALRSGNPPSVALAEARREALAGGFEHPFFWAGFVLYGAD